MNAQAVITRNPGNTVHQTLKNLKEGSEMALSTAKSTAKRWILGSLVPKTPAKLLGTLAMGAILVAAVVPSAALADPVGRPLSEESLAPSKAKLVTSGYLDPWLDPPTGFDTFIDPPTSETPASSEAASDDSEGFDPEFGQPRRQTPQRLLIRLYELYGSVHDASLSALLNASGEAATDSPSFGSKILAAKVEPQLFGAISDMAYPPKVAQVGLGIIHDMTFPPKISQSDTSIFSNGLDVPVENKDYAFVYPAERLEYLTYGAGKARTTSEWTDPGPMGDMIAAAELNSARITRETFVDDYWYLGDPSIEVDVEVDVDVDVPFVGWGDPRLDSGPAVPDLCVTFAPGCGEFLQEPLFPWGFP